jgi:AraC-like DNA-binding protein
MKTSQSSAGAQSGRDGIRPRLPAAGNTGEGLQSVGPLTVIPGLLRELRVDPSRVLANAGLEVTALDSMENQIPYVAMGRLLHDCAVKTGCPHFGLLAGQRMGLSHLGLPGRLARHSPTLGAALRTFVVYHHLNSQGMALFFQQSDVVALGVAVYQTGTEHVEQIYDGVLAMACNVMRELFGPSWAPNSVLFARAKPAAVTPYRRFFFAPCRFDCEQTALLFPARWLKHPMPDANPTLLRMLEREAREKSRINIVFRLRRTLRTILLAGKSSGDEAAQLLSMARRALNRQLQAEGTSFQKVLDEVRFECARQLLEATRIPLDEIATSLGYSTACAFSRAFRRWSGAPPSRHRSLTRRIKSTKPSHL